MLNTILFDLDGTLLPMTQENFIKAYFGGLVKKFAPYGFDKDSLIKGIWAGTNVMIKNDGTQSNSDAFWKTFAGIFGEKVYEYEPEFEQFYKNEFNSVKEVTTPTELSKKLVHMLKDKGYSLVLATNPIFPLVAVQTRLNWLGLSVDDFEYITTYDNSSFCKPNPAYFEQILAKIGKQPENCMMIGNNAVEDLSAAKIGIKTYLVTDFAEDRDNADLTDQQMGSLADFYAFAENLPTL